MKKQLPMIGKRNQFSKFKVVKAVPSTRPKVKANAFESEGEEVEDEEEEEVKEEKEKKHKEPNTDAVAKPSTNEHTAEIEPTVASEVNTNNSIAETDAINKSKVETTDGEESKATSSVKGTEPRTTTADEEEEDEAAAHKKRRQRARQRANKQQRQDVDMDLNELAEHEEDEKYAKWVPPSNQSGDGITHLNDKFGY